MSALFYLDSDNILNRGTVAGDNTGDTLRTAALKINTNFQHLDSAVNALGEGGTSSTYELTLNMLDSTGRAGTILSSPLHVGDAVYYDYDAGVWTGAYADSAHIASHVIVSRNTVGNKVEIAQTGVFNLESDGLPVATLSEHNFYFLPQTSGAFPSTTQDSAVYQMLYYALDTDTIDLNISEAKIFNNALDMHDSAAVQGQIDATLAVTDMHDSAAVQGQIDSNFANDVTFGSDITVGGIGIPNTTTLSGIGAVTYTLTDGNTATLTTDSDKTITLDGTWSGIVGSGFSLMIKNSDVDSDRTMTFEAGTGKTVKFNTENTLTIGAEDYGVASVLVFDANTVLLTATSLDSSLTY
jgi:hypothetical protein